MEKAPKEKPRNDYIKRIYLSWMVFVIKLDGGIEIIFRVLRDALEAMLSHLRKRDRTLRYCLAVRSLGHPVSAINCFTGSPEVSVIA
jgi:hypothetical protein